MLPRPDLSPASFELSVERNVSASPGFVYRAWMRHFDQWFAAPGTLLMHPEVGTPFFFETRFDGQRHAHYGRILTLESDKLIELTWVTGDPGTKGAETVLSVSLKPLEGDTKITLTHAGFISDESKHAHEKGWQLALDELERYIADTVNR